MPEGSLVQLAGSERASLPEATAAGVLDTSQRAEVTVIIRRRAELPAEIVAGPTVLTSEELAERYGADPADVALVRQELAPLQVTAVHPATRRIKVAGTLADLANAFGTTLTQVSSPDHQGRPVTHRYREGPLYVPAALDGVVLAVLGLDTRPQARPHSQPQAAAARGTSYMPNQVADIYNFPTGTTGAGQTVAVIELGGGFVTSDLDAYFGALGIPVPSITAVGVDGASNAPGSDPAGADVEVSFNIDVIGAVAPGAAQVVYFAPNNGDQGFVDAISDAAQASPAPIAISISWGQSEDSWTGQGLSAMNAAMSDAAALGITVCVAAGNSGSTDGVNDGQQHVDFPASSPYALGCGGTKLLASPATGVISSEVVWNQMSSNQGATGGGVSDQFALPSWQANAGVPARAGRNGAAGRGVPDVAGNADPTTGYQIYSGGQAQVLGGTSAVASLWAALIARVAQATGERFGLIQPALYAGVTPGTGVPGFRDITSGNNGAYSAGPGWDACSGLGVADGQYLPGRLIRPLEAGYDSDDIGSTDWLSITEDVNILATLIASSRTLPPLSVGLFGDWGTGKSFFMRRLEDRVTILANAARAATSATPPQPTFYCRYVAQITFNAWHYVEADLWASLATRVFEGLSKYLQIMYPGEAPGKAYRDLISQLETSQTVLAEAEKRRDAAEATLRSAKQRLQDQITERDSRTLAQLAELQPGLGPDVKRLTDTLGLEQDKAQVGDVHKIRTRGRIRLGWQALSHYRLGRAKWLLVLGAFVVAAALLLAWLLALDKPLAAAVASAVALLSGAITALTVLLAGARSVMSTADQILQAKDRQEQDAVNALKREVEQATERVRHLEEDVARVQQLEFPTLDSFVQERAASSDYRKHLGLVALIQRDFQALSDLLTVRSAGRVPKGQLPQVDRIVLYIDDLDRCPPDKVVQVLQAVHLLLAFPLFVVVVGVDSRWLVRSLEHEYDAILSPDKPTEDRPGHADELASTPHNYLEKIFQLPFWLRPMAPDGYGRLIRALASGPPTTDIGTADALADSGSPVLEVKGSGPAPEQDDTRTRPPGPSAIREPAPSGAPIDLTPSALIIGDHELAYAEKLARLIPTPRAAKRFINLYRLLKVGLNEEETTSLAGDNSTPGEYQVALLLLAVMVGAPAEADTIFRIVRSDRLDSWAEVVDELRPQPWDGPTAAEYHSRAAGQLSASSATRWHRLCQILDEVGTPATAQGLAPFQSWADRVGRYSFSAGWMASSYGQPPGRDGATPSARGDRGAATAADS
jgi:kumamolisin